MKPVALGLLVVAALGGLYLVLAGGPETASEFREEPAGPTRAESEEGRGAAVSMHGATPPARVSDGSPDTSPEPPGGDEAPKEGPRKPIVDLRSAGRAWREGRKAEAIAHLRREAARDDGDIMAGIQRRMSLIVALVHTPPHDEALRSELRDHLEKSLIAAINATGMGPRPVSSVYELQYLRDTLYVCVGRAEEALGIESTNCTVCGSWRCRQWSQIQRALGLSDETPEDEVPAADAFFRDFVEFQHLLIETRALGTWNSPGKDPPLPIQKAVAQLVVAAEPDEGDLARAALRWIAQWAHRFEAKLKTWVAREREQLEQGG